MLVLLAVVLGGSALVLGKLSSGASIDLSKLKMNVLDIQNENRTASNDTEDITQSAGQIPVIRTASAPSVIAETPAPLQEGEGFTLTIGGSISLSGEVRKNSRSTDAKVADYADVMMLLAPAVNSDINGVFLENILSDRHKTSDIVAPGAATVLLTDAGFNMAACGFSQVYSSGKDGIEATLETLGSQGIRAVGIHSEEDSGNTEIRNVNGIRTAFLQYTDTLPDKSRKSMQKDGTSKMAPAADISLISEEIASVRKQGAEAVIVMINWGKAGKEPDKNHRALAQEIARAGADLIVGNGSHVPQTAEYCPGENGKDVLCIWSLGTLLSGDRSNIRRMCGYLLHLTVRMDGTGGVTIENPEYTPVYTWKYKQDGRFYYRCIACGGEAPDGMDNDQRKSMAKAAETVRSVLQNSPLTERGRTDAD